MELFYNNEYMHLFLNYYKLIGVGVLSKSILDTTFQILKVPMKPIQNVLRYNVFGTMIINFTTLKR